MPEPKIKTERKKKALNQQAVCITDVDVLNDLKAQEEEKTEIEGQKLEKKTMWEDGKAEREKLKKEKEERKLMKQKEKEKKQRLKDKTLREEGKKFSFCLSQK